jgi:hypothetical protein
MFVRQLEFNDSAAFRSSGIAAKPISTIPFHCSGVDDWLHGFK